jgi:hypothetical protein
VGVFASILLRRQQKLRCAQKGLVRSGVAGEFDPPPVGV